MSLTWAPCASDNGNHVTGFRIYKSESEPGHESLIAEVGPQIHSYTDSSVVNRWQYFYQVSAVNCIGESPLTDEATTYAGAPTQPTNLQATAGNCKIDLVWQVPTSIGGGALQNYQVFRGTSPGTETYLTTRNPTYPGWTDTDVVFGVTYYYRVLAKNTCGESALSNEASSSPILPPSAPLLLSTAAHDSGIDLVWSPPIFLGGTTVGSYKIYSSTDGGVSYSVRGSVLGTETTYTDSGLTNGNTYWYEVSAVNGAGEGPRSIALSASPAGPPSAPQGLVATAGTSKVTLTWSPPATYGDLTLWKYQVYRGVSSGQETEIVGSVPKTTLTYVDSSVVGGTKYFYVVKAFNSHGLEGPASNEVSATPPAPPPPPPFTDNFDDGTTLSPWTGTGSLVYISSSESHSSPYSLYVEYSVSQRTGTQRATSPAITSIDFTKPYSISFWYHRDFAGVSRTSPQMYVIEDGRISILDNANNFYAVTSSGNRLIAASQPYVWCKFQINVDPATSSYHVFINDVDVGTYAFLAQSSSNQITVGSPVNPAGRIACSCYWDDFVVSAYTP